MPLDARNQPASGGCEPPDGPSHQGVDTPRSPWVRLAVACWVIVLITVSIRVLARPGSHSCCPIFRHAAESWLQGEDLYSPDLKTADGLDFYRYSPLVTALLTPLALVPADLGEILWRLVNAGVFLGALAWWCRAVLPRPLTTAQTALLFLLVLPLAAGNLNNGQANLLVIGLVLAATAAAAGERWNWAAVFVALACLLKLYPVAVGLLLAVLYPRRFSGRLVLALAAGLLLPFVLQDPGYVARQYRIWLDYLRADDRSGFPVEQCYRDFQLLCRVWLAPLSSPAYQAVQLLAGAGMAGGCLAARRAGWSRQRLLTLLVGLGTCWMTAFGPATESCTYVLLAPSLAWALLEAVQERRPARVLAWRAGSYGLLLTAALACWFPGGRSLQALGLQPLAALSLLASLLAGLAGGRQEEEAAPSYRQRASPAAP